MKKTLKSATSVVVLALSAYTASAAVLPAQAHAGLLTWTAWLGCVYAGEGSDSCNDYHRFTGR